MLDANEIIKRSFNVACEKNKFRTWAKIFRETIEETFSAQCKPNFENMSFQEWASYYIWDADWGYEDKNKIANFYKLIKEKNLI
tara:strand:- start:561 stop:812 length:252 start_codon:yes stop_codon:yes gene_type:complete